MRLSHLFGKTLREAPAEVDIVSQQLAMRAGLMRRAGNSTSYLPLGWRVQQKLRQIVRAGMNALGGQEILAEQDDILLYSREINSYRDLPRLIYRAASGPVIAYSLHAHRADLDTHVRIIYHAILGMFEKCVVKASAVEAGPGTSHFVMPHAQGHETLLICDSRDCGYASTAQFAEFRTPEGISGEPKPLEKVATPHCPTIAALAEFLKIETRQTIKAVMYVGNESEFVFVVIRGDLDVSKQKLTAALGHGTTLRPATEAEIVKAGAAPGYASPSGLRVAASRGERGKGLVTVVADPSVSVGANFAAGANESGHHFINMNFPRDFKATIVTDIALAAEREGAGCAQCGGTLRAQRAFTLGACRSAGEIESTYLAENGKPQRIWLGEYKMDVEQLMMAIVEQHHDEAGIVWPESVAPFGIHLLRLGKAPETISAADQLYAELQAAGKEVLYDDRDESAGVKFADADLIGAPLRVTVSDKSLKAGGAEVKRRNSAEKSIMPVEAIKDSR
jgi:prolyl-tRNA synthetase